MNPGNRLIMGTRTQCHCEGEAADGRSGTRGERSSISILMGCLENFGMMVGLWLNLSKSCIYMAGSEEDVRQDILAITGFREGQISYRYLGILLASENLKIADYDPLIDALRRRLIAWPNLTLSYIGRA
ncbi:hypothetical protein ZIOFF_060799 [Zingiber officinale]|uniref:Reverse transcriptase n=1 Tax=Zingiber officinale TaxID=94328 RepID=A0A8J5KHX7_ZINOF|nr:hypothetical protein ZIOFF_060799 [Zingiber officinale]